MVWPAIRASLPGPVLTACLAAAAASMLLLSKLLSGGPDAAEGAEEEVQVRVGCLLCTSTGGPTRSCTGFSGARARRTHVFAHPAHNLPPPLSLCLRVSAACPATSGGSLQQSRPHHHQCNEHTTSCSRAVTVSRGGVGSLDGCLVRRSRARDWRDPAIPAGGSVTAGLRELHQRAQR
jgi:hypothetical protein